MSAETEYNELVKYIGQTHGGEAGQMFGKKIIKINGKAGIALSEDCIVFKLPESEHKKGMALAGSVLWDPSGKDRPMKEWVQVSIVHKEKFKGFAKAAAEYVG